MLSHAGVVKSELVRLASFSKWPVEPAMTAVSLVRLAAAGFRYTGDSDAIICDYCETVVRGWLGTHLDPLVEHGSASNHATHHDTPAERINHAGRHEETAGACRRRPVLDRDNGRPTPTLEVDEVPQAPTASSLSLQMALTGVNDVIQSASGDVRDAAAATCNLSKSQIFSVYVHKLFYVGFLRDHEEQTHGRP